VYIYTYIRESAWVLHFVNCKKNIKRPATEYMGSGDTKIGYTPY
jgi:hypothetical protein